MDKVLITKAAYQFLYAYYDAQTKFPLRTAHTGALTTLNDKVIEFMDAVGLDTWERQKIREMVLDFKKEQ